MDFSFSDSKEVDSLDKVPSDFRSLYEEKEGKFVLSQDEKVKSAVSAVTRLNEALKASRLEAKKKGTPIDLSPLQDYGSSPEEIAAGVKAKLEALETAAAGSKEAKLNLDKVKEELSKAHAKDVQGRDGKISALKGQLDKLLVTDQAKTAISELGGDANTIEILMPHILPHVKSIEEEGEIRPYVVDKGGDKRYSGVTAEPMTIKELVEGFKASDKFGKLFPSAAPSGGGMRPGSGSGNGMPVKKGEMTATEKIQAGISKMKR